MTENYSNFSLSQSFRSIWAYGIKSHFSRGICKFLSPSDEHLSLNYFFGGTAGNLGPFCLRTFRMVVSLRMCVDRLQIWVAWRDRHSNDHFTTLGWGGPERYSSNSERKRGIRFCQKIAKQERLTRLFLMKTLQRPTKHLGMTLEPSIFLIYS